MGGELKNILLNNMATELITHKMITNQNVLINAYDSRTIYPTKPKWPRQF